LLAKRRGGNILGSNCEVKGVGLKTSEIPVGHSKDKVAFSKERWGCLGRCARGKNSQQRNN